MSRPLLTEMFNVNEGQLSSMAASAKGDPKVVQALQALASAVDEAGAKVPLKAKQALGEFIRGLAGPPGTPADRSGVVSSAPPPPPAKATGQGGGFVPMGGKRVG